MTKAFFRLPHEFVIPDQASSPVRNLLSALSELRWHLRDACYLRYRCRTLLVTHRCDSPTYNSIQARQISVIRNGREPSAAKLSVRAGRAMR